MELGSKWFADLGPPFGVMYCIKCECVAVRISRLHPVTTYLESYTIRSCSILVTCYRFKRNGEWLLRYTVGTLRTSVQNRPVTLPSYCPADAARHVPETSTVSHFYSLSPFYTAVFVPRRQKVSSRLATHNLYQASP